MPRPQLYILMGLVLLASPAFAQESITYGAIAVRVTDSAGAVLPGADVSVIQQETNAVVRAVTDVQGRARFPYLRHGRYSVAVT